MRNFGRLQRHVAYYRQGTTTAIASPDDIARMGMSTEIEKLLAGQSFSVFGCLQSVGSQRCYQEMLYALNGGQSLLTSMTMEVIQQEYERNNSIESGSALCVFTSQAIE